MGLLKASGVILIKMTPSGRECAYESIRTGWKVRDGPSPCAQSPDCQLPFDWQRALNMKVRTRALCRCRSLALFCIVLHCWLFSHASIKSRSFSAAFESSAKNRGAERVTGLSEPRRERSGGLHLVYRWIFSPTVCPSLSLRRIQLTSAWHRELKIVFIGPPVAIFVPTESAII